MSGLRRLRRILGSAALLLALQAPGAEAAVPSAKSWQLPLSPTEGGVEFRAIGRPSALRIVGQGAPARGTVTVRGGRVSGTLSFDLNTLKTGIALRDRHMKEKYLETSRFPSAVLELRKVALPPEGEIPALKADSVPFEGVLKLHGVERPVSGNVSIEPAEGGKVSWQARFHLKLGDFAISTPSFAGITVADQVEVEARGVAPAVGH